MKKIPNFSCERGGSLLGLQNHLKSRYYTLSLKDTLIIYRGTITITINETITITINETSARKHLLEVK